MKMGEYAQCQIWTTNLQLGEPCFNQRVMASFKVLFIYIYILYKWNKIF